MNNKIILISGDIPDEIAGGSLRKDLRLQIEGNHASIDFLHYYFKNNKDSKLALERMQEHISPIHMLSNGIYLFQYLAKRDYDVELIQLFSFETEKLVRLLREDHLAVVISTSFLTSAEQIDRIANYIKEHSPDTLIIAGGVKIWKSYLTMKKLTNDPIPDKYFGQLKADTYFMDIRVKSPVDIFIVSDKGEQTLIDLLNRLRSGKDYSSMQNLALFKNGKYVFNTTEIEHGEFMEEGIDWGDLPIVADHGEYPVMAGTGCFMKCAFCDFINIRDIEIRSTASLLDELKTIPRIDGVRHVFFTNDNLFFNIKKTREICRGIIDEKLDLRWRSFQRVDVINDETAQLMYESGCREVLLGIESGDATILKNMNKHTTPEKILRAVNALNKAGVNTVSTFIVGFPGETSQTVDNTIRMINDYNTDGPGIHSHCLFLFSLFPLSNIFDKEMRSKYKIKGYLNSWSHSTMNCDEAAGEMARINDTVKPEVSPIYMEAPTVNGLSIPEQKSFYAARTKLMKAQRNLPPDENEDILWDRLEKLIVKATV